MTISRSSDRLRRLEDDIDGRMEKLLDEFYQVYATEDSGVDVFVAYLRAAYGKGYVDALKDGGKMCTDHGYRMPRREETDGRTADVGA